MRGPRSGFAAAPTHSPPSDKPLVRMGARALPRTRAIPDATFPRPMTTTRPMAGTDCFVDGAAPARALAGGAAYPAADGREWIGPAGDPVGKRPVTTRGRLHVAPGVGVDGARLEAFDEPLEVARVGDLDRETGPVFPGEQEQCPRGGRYPAHPWPLWALTKPAPGVTSTPRWQSLGHGVFALLRTGSHRTDEPVALGRLRRIEQERPVLVGQPGRLADRRPSRARRSPR